MILSPATRTLKGQEFLLPQKGAPPMNHGDTQGTPDIESLGISTMRLNPDRGIPRQGEATCARRGEEGVGRGWWERWTDRWAGRERVPDAVRVPCGPGSHMISFTASCVYRTWEAKFRQAEQLGYHPCLESNRLGIPTVDYFEGIII